MVLVLGCSDFLVVSSCVDQESFLRGVQLLLRFFINLMMGESIQIPL